MQLAPQRWQDTPSTAIQKHDVVIAFEERIYDAVIEDLQTREPTEDFKAIHVICLDTKVRWLVDIPNASMIFTAFAHRYFDLGPIQTNATTSRVG